MHSIDRALRGGPHGLTLIELMVVVAVLSIIMVLAIPNFTKARQSANEGSAISSLRTITGMNERYRLRFNRYASSMNDLSNVGLIDENLGDGNKAGYTFSYTGATFTFSCTADPETPGTSGTRYFFVDSSGVIRFSTTGTATSASTPIGD